MKFLRKMERKFGRYAVRNLSTILIAICTIGYIMYFAAPGVLLYYFPFNPEAIFRHGQWWRFFTWIFIPVDQPGIFTIVMLFFYYSVAKTMERTWGDFYFDVFTFSGMIMTVVSACLIYAAGSALHNPYVSLQIQQSCTIYYLLLSILLAFALTYPDTQVLLFFLIPVKIKWLGWLYVVFLAYDFINASSWAARIIMLVSLLNVIVYFLMTRNLRRFSPREVRRRARFRKASGGGTSERIRRHSSRSSGRTDGRFGKVSSGTAGTRSGNGSAVQGAEGQTVGRPSGKYTKINPGGARHCCAICGRTELTNPELEFRFCSKCEGSYEYCQDHLFNHIHVKNGSSPQLAPQAKEGN